jgi:hypothetical protein
MLDMHKKLCFRVLGSPAGCGTALVSRWRALSYWRQWQQSAACATHEALGQVLEALERVPVLTRALMSEQESDSLLGRAWAPALREARVQVLEPALREARAQLLEPALREARVRALENKYPMPLPRLATQGKTC